MRKSTAVTAVVAAALLTVVAGAAAPPDEKPTHGFVAAASLEWKPGPAALPAGAKLAVLEGDPAQEGIFTIRLSLPAGYKLPPHWHPAYEHVTVISGAFHMGTGETFDSEHGHKLGVGDFGYMAPGARHFAWTESETVIQLHGMGPWQIYYVNPADDPRGRK
jgi:quercetin dioxygenase-like cupin family protein